MIGKPKFDYDDRVCFDVEFDGKQVTKTGVVAIIDAYGTFFDDSDVSYDIFVEDMNTLFKHISERRVRPAQD